MNIILLLTSMLHHLRTKLRPFVRDSGVRRSGLPLNIYSLIILNMFFRTSGQPSKGHDHTLLNVTQPSQGVLLPFQTLPERTTQPSYDYHGSADIFQTTKHTNPVDHSSTEGVELLIPLSTGSTLSKELVTSSGVLAELTSRPSHANEILLACLFIENDSNGSLYYDYRRSAAAIDLATEFANDNILPENMTLIKIYVDIGNICTEKNHAATYLLSLTDEHFQCNVIIGPGCGYSMESLYDVSDFLKVPTIGCPAAGVGTETFIGDYTYLTRISFTHISTVRAMTRFFAAFNYTSITILEDQFNSFYAELSSVAETVLRQEAKQVYSQSKLIPFQSDEVTDEFIHDTLLEAVPRSRVFVLLTDAKTVRRFMITAHHLEMANGSYVYCGVDLFPSLSWGMFTPLADDGNNTVALLGFASLLLFSLTTSIEAELDVFNKVIKENSALLYNYTYQPDEEVDVVVGHFYDSIIFYASLVKDMVAAGENHKDSDRMLDRACNYTFFSPVNGDVHTDENGDRENSYVLKNFNPNTQRFEDYLNFPAKSKEVVVLGELQWPNGTTLPPNIPRCGFLGNDRLCQYHISKTSIALAAAIPVLAVVLLLAVGLKFGTRLMNTNSNPFWWRIFISEVTVVNNRKALSHISVTGKSKPSLNADAVTVTSNKEILARDILTLEAVYAGNAVDFRALDKPLHRAAPSMRPIFDAIKRLQHINLQIFIGIAVGDDQLCEYVVGEFCSKGSLMQLLERSSFNLDWDFKSSLLKDIASGMTYLHGSPIGTHGNLTAYTCRIDSNFVLKITDYGLHSLRNPDNLNPPSEYDEDRDYEALLWRPPELLRRQMPPEGTVKGDIYSFAILLQQVILRSPPFRSNHTDHRLGGDALTDKELVTEVKKGTNPPLRPRVPVSSCPPEMHDLLERCWDENPAMRPTFQKVRESLLKQMGKSGDSIIEHLIESMEKHAAGLELEAEKKMQMLVDEKKRSDDILGQMLPKSIALALTQGKHPEPETFESTTVHFSDIDGFPALIAEAVTPADTVHILNTLYSVSDAVIEKFDVYKVETVVDAYMIVSGLPIRNGIHHADHIVSMALQMRREIASMVISRHETPTRLKLRVGVHSGPCVAAIIGTKMPRYCLFGDTVNTSSRMESHGEAGKIQCSSTTKVLLDQIGGFFLIARGEITVKGKGLMETYWIVAKE